jgi:hypothetical protein
MSLMRRMKVVVFASLLSMCLVIHAQAYQHDGVYENPEEQDVPELNTIYLILGTLSDYMGRPTYVDKEHQVDYYYHYEKPLVRYLDSLALAEHKIDITETFINGRYETFSEELSERLNSFYKDGLIIDSLIKSTKEICSFLTGRYLRYGEQLNDSIFKIQVPNSPNHTVIDTLLRRLNCNHIYLIHLKTIPAQFIYYFVPTKELKYCFVHLSSAKKELEDEYKIAVMKILGPAKDYNEMLKIKNERDLNKVIEYFREN